MSSSLPGQQRTPRDDCAPVNIGEYSVRLCAASSGLLRGNGLGLLYGYSFQRCVKLNLERLYCYIRQLKSRVVRHLYRVKLSSIELLRYSLERAGQGSANRRFFREPDAPSGTGFLQPNEMPSGAADHGVENKRRDLFHNRPPITDRLLARV